METKKCEITRVLSNSFIDLIKAAPQNPMVRGHLLKQLGQLPAKEADTFEKIQEWIEGNIEPKAIPQPKLVVSRRNEEAFSVDIEFSETDVGTATYSVDRSGSDSFAFTVDEINELIDEAITDGDSFGGLLDRVRDLLNDDIYDRTDPNMESSDSPEYDNEESTDTENSDWNVESSHQLKDRLNDFIRSHRPEAMEPLGL